MLFMYNYGALKDFLKLSMELNANFKLNIEKII